MSKATRHPAIPSPSRRFRKPASAILALLFIAVLITTQPPYYGWWSFAMQAAGLLLVVAGTFGRLWCALYIAGYKDSVLRVDGPYSICRNPLYFFSFLGLVGIMLYSQIWLMAVIAGVLFKIYYHFVIRAEQKVLQGGFGETYGDYLKKTPCFFPKLSLYHSAKEITVQPAKVLGVAKDVVWFFIALIGIAIINKLHICGALPMYWTWPI